MNVHTIGCNGELFRGDVTWRFDQTTHWYAVQYDVLYLTACLEHAGFGVARYGWVGGIECTNGV